jgi:hypothetical protein
MQAYAWIKCTSILRKAASESAFMEVLKGYVQDLGSIQDTEAFSAKAVSDFENWISRGYYLTPTSGRSTLAALSSHT